MMTWNQVRRVHVELTARCNAHCPQCPRNTEGGYPRADLPLSELLLGDIEQIFPVDTVKHLRSFLFCGNYGDPMVARDLLPILEYLKRNNPALQLKMNTNGSGRSAELWSALGKLLTSCTFSIDGLEDTNALYRRGTHWEKVMQSAQAFIGAGGSATWDYIVFRHNEHQVEEARELSQRLGFKKFVVKKTSRFQKRGRYIGALPIVDRDGAVLYQLEPPVQEIYRNEALRQIDDLGARDGYQDYLATTEIDCKAVSEQQIYLSADGWVLPCCWLGALHNDTRRDRHEVWRRLNELPGGVDAIDAKKRPLRAIIEGRFFQEQVPAGWAPGKPGEGRLTTCAKVCGQLDARSAMYR